MKTYQGSEIRNVAVVGHAQSGKTTLIAAMLHAAKMTPVQGRVADGSAVTAYDEEEVARGLTMQNAVAFAEWQNVKINLVDTPGFHMFTHEARAALLPVESAILVVNAQNGVEPVTERVWRYAEEAHVPRIVLVNQMDHPKAGGGTGLNALIDDIHERWGRNCVPVQLPIVDAQGFHGVVDLVTMQAYTYAPGADGRGKASGEIPASLAADAKARHDALVELVAEGKDELMEEFFDKGTIPEDHLIGALHEAIREDRIFPMLFSSGLANMALDHLLDFLKVYAPAPVERAPIAVHSPAAQAVSGNGAGASEAETATRKVADSEPVAAVVFKTMSDPFAGRISFFKVVSGVLKNDATLENYTRRGQEKLSHLSVMQGRKAIEVPELHAGDIGAVAKLRDTLTGDTLGQKGAEIQARASSHPRAGHDLRHRAQIARRRGQARPRHPQAHGRRSPHPLLPRSPDQRVPHRRRRPAAHRSHRLAPQEALSRRSHAEGAQGPLPRDHSRQGRRAGPAQKADRRPRPVRRLQNQVGAAAARRRLRVCQRHLRRFHSQGLHPRRRKGRRRVGRARLSGRISGGRFPRHPLRRQLPRSRLQRLSFKMAGRIAFRKCMEQAKPCLLEPIMKVEIEAPDDFAGTLMGDLNGRRGRVQGMETKGRTTVINAEVPLAEMLTYGTQLTSMTQGKGSYRMEVNHYEIVPQLVAEKILANAKRPVEEEEE